MDKLSHSLCLSFSFSDLNLMKGISLLDKQLPEIYSKADETLNVASAIQEELPM
jgi:hypothetical protein